MNSPADEIVGLIKELDNFLVAAHANPDGDALGSTGAIGYILAAMGKNFALYNASGMAERLSWLPMPKVLHDDLRALPFKPEAAIILDCGAAARLGDKLSGELPRLPSISIDHHQNNPNFGSLYNWIDPGMASVGQMVSLIAKTAQVKLEGGLAECVFTSLVTDTGSFAFSNVSADVFRLAAELVENGLDVGQVRDKLDKNWTLPKMRLWSKLEERFQIDETGLTAYVTLAKADLESCGATKENLEGFAEHLRLLRGIAVSLVAYSESKNTCKISLRSTGKTDVGLVARIFGGGGHRNAAGALVKSPAEEMMPKVLAAIRENLLDFNDASDIK